MKYLILIFALQAQAVQITPYVHCPKQQEQLINETQDTSTACKNRISQAARCCTGKFKECIVAPIEVSGTSGTQNSGQAYVQGDIANVAVIKSMQEKCDNVADQVAMACNSSPEDKAELRKFVSVAGKLNQCLNDKVLESQKRVKMAGAVIKESEDMNARSQRCKAGGAKTEQDILDCTRGK